MDQTKKFRIDEELSTLIKVAVLRFPDKYDSQSNFIRAGIIKLLKQDQVITPDWQPTKRKI